MAWQLSTRYMGLRKHLKKCLILLISPVLKKSHESKIINVVFDIYSDLSTHNTDRAVRAQGEQVLTYKHISIGKKVVQWHSFL